MDTIFIDAKYNKEIKLDESALKTLNKYKKIALFSSIQFIKLDTVINQLKSHKLISSKPDRTNAQYQLLGCDIFHENLKLPEEPDAFLYIGDGLFHPRALLLASNKPVIQFDPIANNHKVLARKDIKDILNRYKSSLMKFLSSRYIGIFITVKPGQQQFLFSKKLEKKYKDKDFYYFVGNNFDPSSIENYSFIQSWVNTACPRISLDDSVNYSFPMVNINDALEAEEVLKKL